MSFEAWRRRWAAVPPWAGDVSLVAVVAMATVYRIGAGTLQPTDRPATGWAYVIGLGMSAALLLRRRWPAVVLGVITVLWVLYHVWDYPGGAPAVPVWVALYTGAAARHRGPSMVMAAVLIGSDLQGRVATHHLDPFDPTLDGTVAVFVAALLLGEAARSRRSWQAETRARLALLAADRDRAAADRDRAAAARLAEERIRIAQELHDITAHTITVIGVQAGVAAELLEDSPAQARAALGAVRQASREAMHDLRAAVGVLRDGTPAAGTPPGSVPPGSFPGGSVPPGSFPGGSVPPGSFPGDGVPPGSFPGDGVPPGSVPAGSVPGDGLLGGAGPGGAGPGGAGGVGLGGVGLAGVGGPAHPEPPAPGLDRLALMAGACGAGDGPAVALTWQGVRRPLPRAVEATAYRIAQESLTNVLRHAGANRVDVTVEYRPDGLRLEIIDDGARRCSVPGSGLGIRGMAERAGSLGGWLAAGPEPEGGFRVRAWLPVRGAKP